MIYLDPKDTKILNSILRTYPYTFYAYGSRVKEHYKRFSDLDLCIMESISNEQLFDLQARVEESDLSIKIDLKRWLVDMDENFRSLIKNDLKILKLDKP